MYVFIYLYLYLSSVIFTFCQALNEINFEMNAQLAFVFGTTNVLVDKLKLFLRQPIKGSIKSSKQSRNFY